MRPLIFISRLSIWCNFIIRMIVEKKFNAYERAPLTNPTEIQCENIELSTILAEKENTHTLESEFNLNWKPQYGFSLEKNQTYKGSNDSVALTYSKTEAVVEEDWLPIARKIIALLRSKEHICKHIENSLALKGYQATLCVQIGKVISNSFGQYISLANRLGLKLSEPVLKESRSSAIKRELSNVKLENAMQLQKIEWLQQQNNQLRHKFQEIMVQYRLEPIRQFAQKTADLIHCFNQFEIEAYKKLDQQQNQLITLSELRNKLILSRSSVAVQQKHDPDLFKIPQQQQELTQIKKQLSFQKQLYSNLLQKTLSLQKQLAFFQEKHNQHSNSLDIVQPCYQFKPFNESQSMPQPTF